MIMVFYHNMCDNLQVLYFLIFVITVNKEETVNFFQFN
jgi:hypothetical protein